MKFQKNSALLFALLCFVGATANAQQSNTVVTITGPQESNVVSRVERLDPDTRRTNVTTKGKLYQAGRLVEERTEYRGTTDLTALRIYHEGHLVMFQTWDSKSKVTQRTFIRDGVATVTEVSSKPDSVPDLILFHGKGEEIVAGLKRDKHEQLRTLDPAALAEIQRGSKAGTEFMNDLSSEAGTKNHPK